MMVDPERPSRVQALCAGWVVDRAGFVSRIDGGHAKPHVVRYVNTYHAVAGGAAMDPSAGALRPSVVAGRDGRQRDP
jgi:hypothetical protein